MHWLPLWLGLSAQGLRPGSQSISFILESWRRISLFGTHYLMQSPALAEHLKASFEQIYIINLPEREDRRVEISDQLFRVSLALDDPLVTLFPAVRPEHAGPFPSIGARGCFMSHFGVLSDAIARRYKAILILEDDVDWTASAMSSHGVPNLAQVKWDFIHGGDRASVQTVELVHLSPNEPRMLAHFVGLRGDTITKAHAYLGAILERPPGSPEGGPMHVDGAYSWFRKDHEEVRAYVCRPAIATQRPSASDITPPSGVKALPGVRHALSALRKLRKAQWR